MNDEAALNKRIKCEEDAVKIWENAGECICCFQTQQEEHKQLADWLKELRSLRTEKKRKTYARTLHAADDKPVVKGEWTETTQPCGWNEVRCATCSNCGEDFPLGEAELGDIKEDWHFCPSCGADMRGEI